MTTGIWVLGDQLWTEQAALSIREAEKSQTPVILIESRHYAQQRPYHSQKLVLVWSAMRHFAEKLGSAGWQVTYEITDNFEPALLNWIKQNGIGELQVMTPNDRPFTQLIQNLQLDCSLNLIPNNHFLWNQKSFYSGKQRQHTLKTQVVFGQKSNQIICLAHSKGKTHDFKLFKNSRTKFHKFLKVIADKGYQGLAKLHNLSEPARSLREEMLGFPQLS